MSMGLPPKPVGGIEFSGHQFSVRSATLPPFVHPLMINWYGRVMSTLNERLRIIHKFFILFSYNILLLLFFQRLRFRPCFPVFHRPFVVDRCLGDALVSLDVGAPRPSAWLLLVKPAAWRLQSAPPALPQGPPSLSAPPSLRTTVSPSHCLHFRCV